MKRINVWSSPRNISTAFMYSFAQRPDTTVVDEPLYAHYLSKTDSEAGHPGTDEVLASQENSGDRVVQDVIFGAYATPVVLFKQMTHHLIHLDWAFMLETLNIMLIRNPREIIHSYSKVIPNPAMQDIGVEKQLEVFDFLTKSNRLNAVVDARELLMNPRNVLSQLCEKLGLPFDENMLKWQPGPRPEDGVWAKYWYSNVHRSSGFEPFEEKQVKLPPHLESLAQTCQPFYEQLYQAALKA
jgi:Sulfotransferase domain